MWGSGVKRFKCIDLHCGGEPARILISGFPTGNSGSSMAEKRAEMMANFDHVRKILLQVRTGRF